jgi:hypothetical protein
MNTTIVALLLLFLCIFILVCWLVERRSLLRQLAAKDKEICVLNKSLRWYEYTRHQSVLGTLPYSEG